MVRGDLRTDRDHGIFIDPEFHHLALGFNLGDGKIIALRPGDPRRFPGAGAELQRHVAVFVLGAMSHHLAIGQTQYRHRHMFTRVGENARHSDLLRDHSGTHRHDPLLHHFFDGFAVSDYSLISTSCRRQDRASSARLPFAASGPRCPKAAYGCAFRTVPGSSCPREGAVDGEFFDLGRQRNRAAHLRAGAFGGRHDLPGQRSRTR